MRRSQQRVNKDPVVRRKVTVWSSICSLTLTPVSNHPQLCASVFKLFYPQRLRAGCLCMHTPAPNRQEVKGGDLWPLSISVDSVTATAAASSRCADSKRRRLEAAEAKTCTRCSNRKMACLEQIPLSMNRFYIFQDHQSFRQPRGSPQLFWRCSKC